ncbi:MAG TPA: hypothetical protein OIM61_01275 [Clostridiaceae bacterium]|jgi:hypothetical protein|nr:hypothetical protein [Clostridia bacterium]HJJ17905.1 hypothetical protein [Clostridiaceae bacterium]
MAEICINENDIKPLIESYKKVNNSFNLYSFSELKGNKMVCKFFIDKQECRIDIWIKKNSVKIMPAKNPDYANKLIEYITKKTQNSNVQGTQVVFKFNKSMLDYLLSKIDDEFCGLITYTKNDNIIRFKGYNGDVVTFTYYENKVKAMIQAKPLVTFGIIVNILTEITDISIDEIIDINKTLVNVNMPTDKIREKMKNVLKNSYTYLDEAVLKSISGSIILLQQNNYSEDYTGHVTGVFKALEGYLKKVLNKKYNYIIKKKQSFSMFYKDKGNPSKIDSDINLTQDEKDTLNKLYTIYSDKRNVYLHSTVDPSQMRIIEKISEARDLADEILNEIENSYNVFFKRK